MSSPTEAENQANANALISQLQELKAEAQAIAQKIGELDQERVEHSLVAETLTGLDGSRKCYRSPKFFYLISFLKVIRHKSRLLTYFFHSSYSQDDWWSAYRTNGVGSASRN